MFLDGIDFDSNSHEPLALVRANSIENKAYKSNFAKLPRLKHILTQQQQFLPHGLSPKSTSTRPEPAMSFLEKHQLHTEESVSVRGPKVISKNLPEVFISSTPSALKVRKFSGLRKRNRGNEIEPNSVGALGGQTNHTEPDGDAKCFGSPIISNFVGKSHRLREGVSKLAFDEQGALKYAGVREIVERQSTCESPSAFEGMGELSQPAQAERVRSNNGQRQRGSKENLLKPEIVSSLSGNITPTSNILSNNYRSFAGHPMQIDTKLSHQLSVPFPRSATSKPHPNVSLDLKRKASANPKNNVLTDATDLSDYNFKENFRVILKESLNPKPNSRERAFTSVNVSSNNNINSAPNSAVNLINSGALSNLRLINKSEELTKQIKKLFVFKKLSSKSPNNVAPPTPAEVGEEVRVKILDKGSKPTIVSSFRLNELITLKKLKTTQNKGSLKRMLHAPTFKVYDLQEEPMSELGSKEASQIKDRINEWKSNFFNSPYLLRIYSCFWNSPEGCVSILREPSRPGFLNELLVNYGSVPERFIWALAKDLSLGVTEIHQKINKSHGNITINEVCLDAHEHFKLGPGITQAFVNAVQQSKLLQAHEDGGINTVQKVGGSEHNKALNQTKESQSQDIFDFGFVLLQCALGDLSLYDTTGILTLENLKGVLDSRALKKSSQTACCLLHSEELVRKLLASANNSYNNTVKKKVITSNFVMRSPRSAELKNANSNTGFNVSLLDALKMGNRFSGEFLNFMCGCLKLEESQRLKARDLLNHSFLDEDHLCNGPNISLKEFLSVGVRELENSKHVITNISHKHLEKFTDALNVVFLNRNVYEKFERMIKKDPMQKLDDKKIYDLASELEVSPQNLWEHIRSCINDAKIRN